MDSIQIWQIYVLIGLLSTSTFFSLSETALMSLSKITIKSIIEENVKDGKIVEKLTNNPSKLLSAILIGNNIANIGASALATSIATSIFGSKGAGIATGIMTILILIFGEITPKSIAKHHSKKISMKICKLINFLVKLFSPFIWFFSAISYPLVKLFGAQPNLNEPFITEDEIKTIVGVSEEEGILECTQKEMIFNVFDFADTYVKDVMVQRVDISAININTSHTELINILSSEGFSRLPVYNETIDDIVGILNVRDLITYRGNSEDFNLSSYLREAYFTYEFKKIKELYSEMIKTRNHMAIVLDEYGGIVGIVTIEDLIEQVFGDIEDEYDDYEEEITVINENEYIVSGSIRLDNLYEELNINAECEQYDSLGGLIIDKLGAFPEKNTVVEFNNFKFKVEEIEKNRIKKVRILT